MENRKIIIAGGGTGGHIFPALAIAGSLKVLHDQVEILFVGARGKMEMEKIPAAGYKIVGLDIAGYNRSSLIRNVGLPLKLLKSFFQVRRLLKEFRPDAVVGVGGYSSFPVLRAAQARGIPTFIHESNSLPGKSNLMLAKRATEIFVPSEGMEKYFPPGKVMVSGNPVRKIFYQEVSRPKALEFFGLKAGITTVLVIGGSLGAMSINEAIADHIDDFKNNGLQLIWQTGKNYAASAASYEEERMNVWTHAFIDRMELAYAAADVVIGRSGAMTIAELCAVGKPAIFVPYPFSAENHQVVNAERLVQQKAALMVPDAEVKSGLIPELLRLTSDGDLMKEMGSQISKLGIRDADSRIAGEILKKINKEDDKNK